MSEKNLADSGKPSGDRDSGPNALFIENFNHTTNDIDALRRLAEVDPMLAREYISSKDAESRRDTVSFIIAIVTTAILAACVIGGGAYVLVNFGPFKSIAFVILTLSVSHLLRVILTGEWSPTSWLGHLLKGREPKE